MSQETVTLNQIESHLWESANILRGPVDAADFKTYIFPLLFFKRICDVWDEEYEEIVADAGDAELALPVRPPAPIDEMMRQSSITRIIKPLSANEAGQVAISGNFKYDLSV